MPDKICSLRPLGAADIDLALEIIKDFDEDDYDCALDTFNNPQNSELFVFVDGDEIVGVTGFKAATGTDRAYWLEWTYLAEEYQGQGLGRAMLEELFELLKQQDCRKLFVQVSDYVDPEDGDIYAVALHLYKSIGFVEELVHPDYYDVGESQLIYSYSFQLSAPMGSVADDTRDTSLLDVFLVEETDDVYAVDWEFAEATAKESQQISDLLTSAEKKGARSLFITFPSNVPNVESVLADFGFSLCGMLTNYIEESVHEKHFRFDF